MPAQRILVAMSGGVDSSVAAALLREQGHAVSGVFMRVWDGTRDATAAPVGDDDAAGIADADSAASAAGAASAPIERHGCYGPGEEGEIASARQVASRLGIDLHVLDLRGAYRSCVLDYFGAEYAAGRTPNPCVRCNRRVKFAALPAAARAAGLEFDLFATGHYARLERTGDGRVLLRKALDRTKDQTYFLSALTAEQLAMSLFPLGELMKSEVRAIARRLGLPAAERAESQDFAAAALAARLRGPARPGPILDREGRLLGEHQGIAGYTIGQRRGLGIAAPHPLYVTAIDAGRNALIVGPREELLGDSLVAGEVNWIGGGGSGGVRPGSEAGASRSPSEAPAAVRMPAEGLGVRARIRYRHREAPATLHPRGDGTIAVRFAQPQSAITPGQIAVFYDDDLVLGGGVILRTGGETGGCLPPTCSRRGRAT